MNTLKTILALTFLYCAGCAELDKLSPTYAGHPVIAATQPGATTQPAEPRQPILQVADVAKRTTENPVVIDVAHGVPYGDLVLSAIGSIAGLVIAIDQARRKGQAQAQAAASSSKLDTIASAAGAPDHTTAVTAAVTSLTAQPQPPVVVVPPATT